jgi:aminoglycoside phosphotransferase (APT) family kinase protein
LGDLQTDLETVLGATIAGLRRLSGGASRETWSFDADDRPLILQRDVPRSVKVTGMDVEVAVVRAAKAAAVPVPSVVTSSADELDTPLGPNWMIVERISGEALARRILRDDEYRHARSVLAAQCGDALARIHSIEVAAVPALVEVDQLTTLRDSLDASERPLPVFELGYRWLEQHRQKGGRRAVVHGDFRNGNIVVGSDGLRAVLDWELAHIGDPLEDLGWICVRAWRFGGRPRVGGFGSVDELVTAYEAVAGEGVDREALRWWELLGTIRWGIICQAQANTHLTGQVRSVELAAIGRRVCEVEHDVLELLT